MNKEAIREISLKAIEKFRLIDDTFMSVALEDIETAEFILRILLENDSLKIEKVKTQHTVKSLTEHSVIFDCFAKDSSGCLYDIEVQRTKQGATPKRARYNSAVLDIDTLEKGKDYSELRDSYVIFITEDDYFNKGIAMYHIDRTVKELDNECFNDGSHIIYVNSKYQNSKDSIGLLMQDFYKTKANDFNYTVLANRIRYLKEDEKGVNHMCQISEDLIQEGKKDEKLSIIKKMIEKNMSIEEISDIVDLSVEEIQKLLNK